MLYKKEEKKYVKSSNNFTQNLSHDYESNNTYVHKPHRETIITTTC